MAVLGEGLSVGEIGCSMLEFGCPLGKSGCSVGEIAVMLQERLAVVYR